MSSLGARVRVGGGQGRRLPVFERISFLLLLLRPLCFLVGLANSHLADERSSRHGAPGWIPRVEIYILGIAVCGETTF